MKKNLLVVVIVAMSVLLPKVSFGATDSTEETSKTSVVHLELRRPIPVAEVVSPDKIGEVLSTGSIERWQTANEGSEVVSVKPLFQNNHLVGWDIVVKSVKKPERRILIWKYVKSEPFAVPSGESLDSVLARSWATAKNNLPLRKFGGKPMMGPYTDPQPVAMCLGTQMNKEGKEETVVYGLWFSAIVDWDHLTGKQKAQKPVKK